MSEHVLKCIFVLTEGEQQVNSLRPASSKSPSTVSSHVSLTEEACARACRSLDLAAIPERLPCRESERAKVEAFLTRALHRNSRYRTVSSQQFTFSNVLPIAPHVSPLFSLHITLVFC